MVTKNLNEWRNQISCMICRTRSCIFDRMWSLAVSMHVTIVLSCNVWKTTKLWMWKQVTILSVLCKVTNPTNWSTWPSSQLSSQTKPLSLLWCSALLIAFLMASLRIGEWRKSLQCHTPANWFTWDHCLSSGSPMLKVTFWLTSQQCRYLRLPHFYHKQKEYYSSSVAPLTCWLPL